MPDGSAADPASIGFAVALAAALTEDGADLLSNGSARVSKEEAERAVEEQVEALWNRIPRTQDGAISHRVEDMELWSDFVCASLGLLDSEGDEETDFSAPISSYPPSRHRYGPSRSSPSRFSPFPRSRSSSSQFFAYLGALTSNSTLIQAAFDQSRLYRQYLHDNRTGVWTHIFIPGGGEDEDDGLWATGLFLPSSLFLSTTADDDE
jgi:hypothetical protein